MLSFGISDGNVAVPMLGENHWDEFSIEVPWGTVEGRKGEGR